ncbi:hypothetical protein [Marinomonas communis]|uniref:Uncharacterized protein n=1 Tax=Marinomonas communis TaxID=28254 RepID=A0A4R6X1S9_9GAMM|nr:hypothetical protein [Marinomonas communis]TDR05949.1 hypothetical protein C8D85_3486 [Marinomonas communis]
MMRFSSKALQPLICLLIGLLIGLGVAIDWDISIDLGTTKDGWGVTSSIGTLIGGLSTFGLFVLGLLASRSWLSQTKIKLLIDSSKALAVEVSSLSMFMSINTTGEPSTLKVAAGDFSEGECLLKDTSTYSHSEFLAVIRERSASIELTLNELDSLSKSFKDPRISEAIKNCRVEARELYLKRKLAEMLLNEAGEEPNYSDMASILIWYGFYARKIHHIILEDKPLLNRMQKLFN